MTEYSTTSEPPPGGVCCQGQVFCNQRCTKTHPINLRPTATSALCRTRCKSRENQVSRRSKLHEKGGNKSYPMPNCTAILDDLKPSWKEITNRFFFSNENAILLFVFCFFEGGFKALKIPVYYIILRTTIDLWK